LTHDTPVAFATVIETVPDTDAPLPGAVICTALEVGTAVGVGAIVDVGALVEVGPAVGVGVRVEVGPADGVAVAPLFWTVTVTDAVPIAVLLLLNAVADTV
jgi:hypothetical protein